MEESAFELSSLYRRRIALSCKILDSERLQFCEDSQIQTGHKEPNMAEDVKINHFQLPQDRPRMNASLHFQ
jgi:hypothetical protein